MTRGRAAAMQGEARAYIIGAVVGQGPNAVVVAEK